MIDLKLVEGEWVVSGRLSISTETLDALNRGEYERFTDSTE